MNNPNPEEVKRIVDSVLPPPKEWTGEEVFGRLRQAHQRAFNAVKPIVVADGFIRDPQTLAVIAGRIYVEEFSRWDKDELVHLLAATNASYTLEQLG